MFLCKSDFDRTKCRPIYPKVDLTGENMQQPIYSLIIYIFESGNCRLLNKALYICFTVSIPMN